jgi:hypothetical protein
MDSATVYRVHLGWMYRCIPCDAYVGCHRGTTKPLGTPADKRTRKLRRQAHAHFDPLWREKAGRGGNTARADGYAWLAREMGLSLDECHIGMMGAEQCRQVVRLCKPWLVRHPYNPGIPPGPPAYDPNRPD